jgi:hypothetical protein
MTGLKTRMMTAFVGAQASRPRGCGVVGLKPERRTTG